MSTRSTRTHEIEKHDLPVVPPGCRQETFAQSRDSKNEALHQRFLTMVVKTESLKEEIDSLFEKTDVHALMQELEKQLPDE
jgi:hypothetical protein